MLKNRILTVGLVAITIIMAIQWQHNIGKYYQVDFSAYWSAGRAINEKVYRYNYETEDSEGNRFKHAMFLNPPVVAHPFRLVSLFSFHTAKTIWYYFQILLFIGTIILLAKNNRERVTITAITIIGMPLMFWPLFAELERGETNMLTLASVALTYYFWRKNKYLTAGFVLGVGSVLKFPLLLILSIPFALKQWRFLFAGIATFAGIFLLSLAIDGNDINIAYFTKYLPVIAEHGRLPEDVYSAKGPPGTTTTVWEERKYITSYQFGASSGSATRFFRSWSNNALDKSLVIGGAGITAVIILISAQKQKLNSLLSAKRKQWENIAWSAVVMATLVLHTLSWVTNYVVFIFVILLLWRFCLSPSNQAFVKILKYGILLGTLGIVIGDPVMRLIPPLHEVIDILIRNRVWLGGATVWGILLVLLLQPTRRFLGNHN